MRIAIVSSGSSIHVKKIANALVERGHNITLYTLPNHVKLLNDFDKRISIVKLPVRGMIGYYLNVPFLRKELIKHKYDLVNSHYASGYGTLSRLTNIHPIALAVFGSDVYEYPYKSKLNMHRIIKNLNNADIITSTSNVMAEEVRKFYREDKPIYVTPFGVNVDVFKPQKVEKDDVFEFGIVKKIEPKYGIDILIKAYKIFCQKYPSVKSRLVIYGRGSAVEDYKKLSMDLHIEEKVEFKGFVANELVPYVLSHMNVGCYSSILDSESFGVAVVEAMACGVPVIATNVSGFSEVVKDGKTGMLVEKNNISALAEAMIRMYEMDEEGRTEMGNAGIQRVHELYKFSDNMDTYENALRLAVKYNDY